LGWLIIKKVGGKNARLYLSSALFLRRTEFKELVGHVLEQHM
jgi:hypothetical protein